MTKRNAAARQRHSSGKSTAGRTPNPTSFKPGNQWRWEPGQSGNPAGYSPSLLLGAAYRKLLAQPFPKHMRKAVSELVEAGASWADIIALAQMQAAAKGKTFAAVEIRQATEGSKLSGADGGPLAVLLTSDDMVLARDKARRYEQERLSEAESKSGG